MFPTILIFLLLATRAIIAPPGMGWTFALCQLCILTVLLSPHPCQQSPTCVWKLSTNHDNNPPCSNGSRRLVDADGGLGHALWAPGKAGNILEASQSPDRRFVHSSGRKKGGAGDESTTHDRSFSGFRETRSKPRSSSRRVG